MSRALIFCAVVAGLSQLFSSVPAYAGEHNYVEALQKSIYFYEIQRSGPLPREENNFLATQLHRGFLPNRVEWRGDSYLDDGHYNQFGEPIGLDLTGGWHDAGDHVKFGLPMAFSASVVGWGIWEFWDAYEKSGQLVYALDNIRWVSDYFMKAHVADYEFYGQVGDGIIDHSLWAAPETQWPELKRIHGAEAYRPALKLTMDNPGADLVAQTAAALTIASMIFKRNSVNEPQDADYARELLRHAEQLFDFAYKTKDYTHNGEDPNPGTYTNSMIDDKGNNYAMNYYNATSGAKDEIPWAAGWLYLATNNADYLHKAEEGYNEIAGNTGHFAWYPSWDDIRNAVYFLMQKVAATPDYARDTAISDGERIDGFYNYELHSSNYIQQMMHNKAYTPAGMLYLDGFASARAAAMVAMVAMVQRKYLVEQSMKRGSQQELLEFARQQIDYILGDNPHELSYVAGYGSRWQLAAHHRASHGSTRNDINDPSAPVHVLYGALVGGPADDDSYSTDRADFPMTEVATDMNAGLTGALAGLAGVYGGMPLADFPLPEDRSQAGVQVLARVGYPSGDTRGSGALLNIKILNRTAYPPKEIVDARFRYFMDLGDEVDNGYVIKDLVVAYYYNSFDRNNVVLNKWGDDPGLYYVEGEIGTISPVGDVQMSASMELYVGNYELGGWDFANDYSYRGLDADSFEPAKNIVLYSSDGKILWGREPNITQATPSSASSSQRSRNSSSGASASSVSSKGSTSSSRSSIHNDPAMGAGGLSGWFTAFLVALVACLRGCEKSIINAGWQRNASSSVNLAIGAGLAKSGFQRRILSPPPG